MITDALQRDYMEVGTPVSNKYYLGAPSGEMYGLDQGLNRFSPEAIAALRPDTDVPGLYLTGDYPPGAPLFAVGRNRLRPEIFFELMKCLTASVKLCMPAHVRVHSCVHERTPTHTLTCIHADVHTQDYTRAHTCTRRRAHARTHTHNLRAPLPDQATTFDPLYLPQHPCPCLYCTYHIHPSYYLFTYYIQPPFRPIFLPPNPLTHTPLPAPSNLHLPLSLPHSLPTPDPLSTPSALTLLPATLSHISHVAYLATTTPVHPYRLVIYTCHSLLPHPVYLPPTLLSTPPTHP